MKLNQSVKSQLKKSNSHKNKIDFTQLRRTLKTSEASEVSIYIKLYSLLSPRADTSKASGGDVRVLSSTEQI